MRLALYRKHLHSEITYAPYVVSRLGREGTPKLGLGVTMVPYDGASLYGDMIRCIHREHFYFQKTDQSKHLRPSSRGEISCSLCKQRSRTP